jgi:hypothetical protein
LAFCMCTQIQYAQQWDATHQITGGLSHCKIWPAYWVLCCRMDTLQCVQGINNCDR